MKNTLNKPMSDPVSIYTLDPELDEALHPIKHHDDTKPNRIPTLAVILGVASMFIGAATTVAIIYVAIHFIAKHW